MGTRQSLPGRYASSRNRKALFRKHGPAVFRSVIFILKTHIKKELSLLHISMLSRQLRLFLSLTVKTEAVQTQLSVVFYLIARTVSTSSVLSFLK